MLMPLFRPFVTRCIERTWHHVASPRCPATAQVTRSSVKRRRLLPRRLQSESLAINTLWLFCIFIAATKHAFHTDNGLRYSRLFYRSQLITNIETLLHTVSLLSETLREPHYIHKHISTHLSLSSSRKIQ